MLYKINEFCFNLYICNSTIATKKENIAAMTTCKMFEVDCQSFDNEKFAY